MNPMHEELIESVFGELPDGREIHLFTLHSGKISARVMTYGARLVSLEVPDRHGKIADVVLGYDTLTPYISDAKTYFGAIVGRYANRIARGTFVLNGQRYHLPTNDGDNSLHGGTQGFDKQIWEAQIIPHGVELAWVSKNGDQGYPGTLTTRVRYTMHAATLRIEYFATTDADTVVNFTNHSYFNLAGEGQGNVLNHLLTVNAEQYTPVDADLIPTGQLASVAGTPFDFRQATVIGQRIFQENEQLTYAKGYDQNFVLGSADDGVTLREAALVVEPESGRVCTVRTTQPGVQVYSGNFLNGAIPGKHGHIYKKHAGLCLETQHFPDSPNHPGFPTAVLKPHQTFHSVTEYEFSTEP